MVVYFLADLRERNVNALIGKESVRATTLTDIACHSATKNFYALARSDILCVATARLPLLRLVSGLIERRFYNNFCHSHLAIRSGRSRWFPSYGGRHRLSSAPYLLRNNPNGQREAR